MLVHIIDDDPIFLEILSRYCFPHRAHCFPEALSATSALDQETPDLIFLDLMLPGFDAFAYLDEIITYPDTKDVPVVLISSLYHTMPDLSNYNVIRYLDKTTFTPDDVKAILQQIETKLNRPKPKNLKQPLKSDITP